MTLRPWLLFLALWLVPLGCGGYAPAARQPEPSPTLTAVPTAPPGPTPGSAPVTLTPGDVVQVAVYPDAPARPDSRCLELVAYMVPASGVGKFPGRPMACRVGPDEVFNYQFIAGADGLLYLYRAKIIALTTRMIPGPRPSILDCWEVVAYFLPASADPATAGSGITCWLKPLPRGHEHREGIKIWVMLPVDARDIRFAPETHCWELTRYLGLPRGVDTFPVACILK
jgi:hypothetical protein